MNALYGGIDAGGTKFLCSVAEAPDAPPVAIARIATTTPAETLSAVIDFFRPHSLRALGIATFGPVDLEGGSITYGHILRTPKPGWQYTALMRIADELGLPVVIETDVNAAALAETLYGAALTCDPAIYFTVGTGIGGGAIVRGETLGGLGHPEMGHIPVERRIGDAFVGSCPAHGACLEGMAGGRAIAERWGIPAEDLPPSSAAWEMEAFYLAQAVAGAIYTFAPERVVLGGGVMRAPGLLTLVRRATAERMAGYLPKVESVLDELIVAPGSGPDPGLLGALELARRAALD